MKKIFVVITISVITSLLLTSCKKDSSNPNDLSGTVWVNKVAGTGMVETLTFTSATTFTDVLVSGTSNLSVSGTYTYIPPTVKMYNTSGTVTQTGTISGNTFTSSSTSGTPVYYTKQ